MKFRTGFVSNSSSASFIVKWTSTSEDYNNVVEALCAVYEVPYDLFDEEVNRFRNVPEYLVDETRKIMELNKLTTENGNVFITEFFTAMMNSGDDFGTIAKSFLINLITCEACGLIDAQTERDDG